MLDINQLLLARDVARASRRHIDASAADEIEAGLVIDFLSAEIERLMHGPFTLAEAIASGRQFMRNGWSAWVSDITESPDGPEAITSDGSHVVWLHIDDITACDYELQEGGEE